MQTLLSWTPINGVWLKCLPLLEKTASHSLESASPVSYTHLTMNGTFFQQSFESKGIEVITPDVAEKEYIGRKIETELELGKVVSDTQNNFRTIAERIIQDENVDTIILGCTELPLIFKGIDLSVPFLNVMQVHIDSLIDLIMSE